MKLTKKQLKQARSIIASENVSKRWENTSKEERASHAKKMVQSRIDKKKLSTVNKNKS